MGLGILIISLTYSLFHIRYSVGFSDEPYQILVAQDWYNNPSVFGGAFVAHLWGNVFGWSMLSFRYLFCCIFFLTVLLGTLFFYRKSGMRGLSLGVLGVCLFLQNAWFYSWNAFSTFSLVVTALWLINIINSPKIKGYIGLGIWCCMSSTFRFPNIVVVGVIPVFILIRAWEQKQWRTGFMQILAFLLSSIISWLLIIGICYGTPEEYLHHMSETIVNNHDILDMIKKMIRSTIFGISSNGIGVLTLGACMIYFSDCIKYKVFAKMLPVLYSILLISILWFFKDEMYSFTRNGLCIGFMILGVVYVALKLKGEIFLGKGIEIMIILCFAILPMIGSNVGYTKILSNIVYPVVGAYVFPYMGKRSRIFLISTIIPFMLYIPLNNFYHIYESGGYIESTESVSSPMLKGLKVEKSDADILNSIHKILDENKDKEVIFESNHPSHYIGYYMSGRIPPYATNEWSIDGLMENNTTHIAEALEYVTKRKRELVVVIVPTNHRGFFSIEGLSRLENEYIRLGAKPENREGVKLYKFPAIAQ